jgi:hypothetical protein
MHPSKIAVLVGSLSALCLAAAERDARACGGCFHPPTQTTSDITDERMLLSVSTQQTTLYDQIRYAGNPSSFAWVLPIHGTVDVGLSADVLFDSIDVLTETTINPPESTCAGPPTCGGGVNFGGGGSSSGTSGGAAPPVTVTKQQNVGPYETVQLHSTDPNALASWLAANGFDIPAAVQPVISAYVNEGFDFLAMKLLPDQGVQSMRPVRVTSQGASLSLPLRMAAIGTGNTVGITIWVVADGRYEPQNFPFFHIDDGQLIWDWSTNLSNYTTLRVQDEANLGGKGWEIESSITLNEGLVTSVIMSGGQYYAGGGFGGGAPTEDAGEDYLPIDAPDGGDGGESADNVRAEDIAALFAGMTGPSVRVTRMRSDISHAAMTADFVLQASSDQSELSNQRFVTQSVNETCATYPPCPPLSSSGAVGSSTSSSSGSGATAGNGNGTGGGSGTVVGGCAAAPDSRSDTGVRLGVLAAMIGLAVLRSRRRRTRRSREE